MDLNPLNPLQSTWIEMKPNKPLCGGNLTKFAQPQFSNPFSNSAKVIQLPRMSALNLNLNRGGRSWMYAAVPPLPTVVRAVPAGARCPWPSPS
jgi:hypothetical protein